MNRSLIAPAAVAGLILTAGLAAPAQASHDGWHAKECWLQTDGTTLRVKMRFNTDGSLKIRVSHPRGTGRFDNDRVVSTFGSVGFEGVGWTSPDGKMATGGGVSFEGFGNKPVHRTEYAKPGKTTVIVSFKLDSGVTRTRSCSKRFD